MYNWQCFNTFGQCVGRCNTIGSTLITKKVWHHCNKVTYVNPYPFRLVDRYCVRWVIWNQPHSHHNCKNSGGIWLHLDLSKCVAIILLYYSVVDNGMKIYAVWEEYLWKNYICIDRNWLTNSDRCVKARCVSSCHKKFFYQLNWNLSNVTNSEFV